jgi:hypothetical protein
MTAAEPRSGVRRSARNPTAQSNRSLHLQPLLQDSAVSILRVTGSELPAATRREDVNSRISARTWTPRDARNVKKQRCNVPSPLFCRTRAIWARDTIASTSKVRCLGVSPMRANQNGLLLSVRRLAREDDSSARSCKLQLTSAYYCGKWWSCEMRM